MIGIDFNYIGFGDYYDEMINIIMVIHDKNMQDDFNIRLKFQSEIQSENFDVILFYSEDAYGIISYNLFLPDGSLILFANINQDYFFEYWSSDDNHFIWDIQDKRNYFNGEYADEHIEKRVKLQLKPYYSNYVDEINMGTLYFMKRNEALPIIKLLDTGSVTKSAIF